MSGKRGNKIVALGVGVVTLFLDQLSKFLASSLLIEGVRTSFLPPLLYLTYIENRGISFGLLQGKVSTLLILFLSLLALGFLFLLSRRENSLIEKVGSGLLAGGILGNVVDRIRIGGVIDFLDLRVWPIFNLADSAITIGIILLLCKEIQKLRNHRYTQMNAD